MPNLIISFPRYLLTAQYVTNSFLDAQGLPKSTHFSVKKPEKSLTALLNYVLKKYLDMDTDVEEYVVPAVEYVKVNYHYDLHTKTISAQVITASGGAGRQLPRAIGDLARIGERHSRVIWLPHSAGVRKLMSPMPKLGLVPLLIAASFNSVGKTKYPLVLFKSVFLFFNVGSDLVIFR